MPDLKMKTTAQSISFFGFSTWTTNLSLRRFLLFVFSVCLTCFLLVAKNCFCVLSPPTRLKSFPRVLHAFNRGTAVYSWFGESWASNLVSMMDFFFKISLSLYLVLLFPFHILCPRAIGFLNLVTWEWYLVKAGNIWISERVENLKQSLLQRRNSIIQTWEQIACLMDWKINQKYF